MYIQTTVQSTVSDRCECATSAVAAVVEEFRPGKWNWECIIYAIYLHIHTLTLNNIQFCTQMHILDGGRHTSVDNRMEEMQG